MADIKVYEMRKDVVIAYQVEGTGTKQITVSLNESGWYDQAYHGNVLSQTVGGVRPGDYMMYEGNGLWKAVKREEFEAIFKQTDLKAVKYEKGSFYVDIPESENATESNFINECLPKVVEEPAVADVNCVVEEEPAVLIIKEQVKVEEAPKKKKKSVRDL